MNSLVNMRQFVRTPVLILLTSVLSLWACSPAARRPEEYLDPVTAAMVSSVAAPMVFARGHPDVAANSRQYATVAAVSVNRSGHYEFLLLVYVWSTVDARLGAGARAGDSLLILADDRAIRLQRDTRTLAEAGVGQRIHAPLHARSTPRIYHTDSATLEFESNARHLRIQFEGDPDSRPFELWQDGRRELGQLAAAGK